MRCCESTSEERRAGNLHAAFCGSRRWVTASGDPVGAIERSLLYPAPPDDTNLSNSRYSSVWAAGAIASTPREIAKWSHALYSGDFLEDASMKSMLVTEPRRIGRGTLPVGLGVWKVEIDSGLAWGNGGELYPFRSGTFYMPELGISIAYSFGWTDSGRLSRPGRHLVRAYIGNRPDDISMCFD